MRKPPPSIRDHTLQSLRQAMQHDSAGDREALATFERMGVQALPLLERTISDPSRSVFLRLAAAWLLGRIGGPQAALALSRAAKLADADIAGAARAAFSRIQRRDAG